MVGDTGSQSELKYDFDRLEIAPFLPSHAERVLDVGCGSGAFGATLRAHLPHLRDLWAVEPDPDMATAAQQYFDQVCIGLFPHAVQQETDIGLFDCVTFNDVLEHIEEPESALRAAVPLLAPGGRVVASIPNVRHVSVLHEVAVRGEFRYTERGILDRTHLRFFTRRSMMRLFLDSGYRVERMGGINMRRRHKPLNALSGGLLSDFLYQQYVVVAVPTTDSCGPPTPDTAAVRAHGLLA